MSNVKRDFNLVAKILLGISMFSVAAAIITCFTGFSSHKYLTAHDKMLITETVIDLCILVASVLTFMKKRYGLIALISLFFIRTGNIPLDGNVPYVYLLGGKTAHLISDFLPFAIAMFFRKDGISGWISMLASEEYLSSLKNPDTIKQESIDNTLTDNEDDHDALEHTEEDVDLNNSTSTIESNVPCTESTTEIDAPLISEDSKGQELSIIQDDKTGSNETEPSLNKNVGAPPSRHKSVKYVIIILACLVFGFVGVSLIVVTTKSYPDYISSFEDKCRYTFNVPNDTLALSLIHQIYSSRDTNFFVIVKPGGSVLALYADRFYRNRHYIFEHIPHEMILNATSVLTDTNTISVSGYYIEVDYGVVKVHKGYNSKHWFHITEHGPRFYETTVYDYDEELNREIQIIDNAASLRVTDINIIDSIGGYYESEENFSKATDYYRAVLNSMKHNYDIEARLAYSLIRNDEIDEARVMANEVLTKQPQNELALTALALIEAGNLNWSGAKKYSKRAIDYNTKESDAFFVYAESLFKQGEKKLAREYYSKAVEMKRNSWLRKKYSECGGCPFDVLSFHFAFYDSHGNPLTYHDDKLLSSKSQYLDTYIDANVLREEDAVIGIKLMENGVLMRGESSKNGFTYTQKIRGRAPGTQQIFLSGWGSDYMGFWSKGLYDIELWHNEEKIAEDSFRVY